MVPDFEELTMSCRDNLKANDSNTVLSVVRDKWAVHLGTGEGRGLLHLPGAPVLLS